MASLPDSASRSAIDIAKFRDGRREVMSDAVAVEEPLEIRLGYRSTHGHATQSISITMRTPGDDAELAAGFLLSESIVSTAADIVTIAPCGTPAPDSGHHNTVLVELAPDVTVDLGRLKRHFYTTSSCGVCGKASLDALAATGAAALTAKLPRIARETLIELPDRLRAAQPTFAATGGLHAAAAFNAAGELVCVREDVGRHNAVDKVVGRLLLDRRLGENEGDELGLLVSGRASFELVQKALVAGMPILAAVGAPSSLAVRLANRYDMTLVGFLRGDTFNAYSGEARMA